MASELRRCVLSPVARLGVASVLTIAAGAAAPAPAEAQWWGWNSSYGYSSGYGNEQVQRRRRAGEAQGRIFGEQPRNEAGRRTQGETRRKQGEGSGRKTRNAANSKPAAAPKSGPSYEVTGSAYGPLQVVISLQSQSLKVYNGSGTQIASSRISSNRDKAAGGKWSGLACGLVLVRGSGMLRTERGA